MWDGDGHMDGWGSAWMMLLALLVWGITVIAVVVAIRELGRRGDRSAAVPSHADAEPRAELERRYVRGEIAREQFLQMRDDLEGSGSQRE